VTGSIDEKVRHAVTKLSNLHFPSTHAAAERVVRMGEDPSTVFVTGCPSVDLAASVLEDPARDFDPYEKYGGVGDEPALGDGYVVVLQHPVTTEHKEARAHALETLRAVREAGLPALWFWPNVDAGSDGTSAAIRAFRENQRPKGLHFFKGMSPADFLKLVFGARCLVGNSSMGIREGAFLGVPVVNVGTRQQGRDRGRNVLDVGYDAAEIARGIARQARVGRYPSDPLYGDGRAGERIARLLASAPLKIEKRLDYGPIGEDARGAEPRPELHLLAGGRGA
jgi:UDP-hydrolysing UDP-N-acetyl-D-glucosamine 2-epimerase